MKLKIAHGNENPTSKSHHFTKQKSKRFSHKPKTPPLKSNLSISQETLYKIEDYKAIAFIPEITLTDSEFEDPLKSIISLRKKYEAFGAIKIIAPNKWMMPFEFPMKGKPVTTRKQIIQDLTKGKVPFFLHFLEPDIL